MLNKPLERPLLDAIQQAYGKQAGVSLSKVFDRLRIRLPGYGEAFHATDNSFIVFLEPYGCLIKIGPRYPSSADRVTHETMIQPIGVVDDHVLHFELLPGIRIGELNDYQIASIVYLMGQDNIIIADLSKSAFGFVDVEHPVFEAAPIMVDREACVRRGSSVYQSNSLQYERLHQNQADYYYRSELLPRNINKEQWVGANASFDDLRRLFNECFYGGKDMREFWNMMQFMKDNPSHPLCAGWDGAFNQFKEPLQSSRGIFLL